MKSPLLKLLCALAMIALAMPAMAAESTAPKAQATPAAKTAEVKPAAAAPAPVAAKPAEVKPATAAPKAAAPKSAVVKAAEPKPAPAVKPAAKAITAPAAKPAVRKRAPRPAMPVVKYDPAVAAKIPAFQAYPRDPKWVARHYGFVERARQGKCDVLFLGDSIDLIAVGGLERGVDAARDGEDRVNALGAELADDRSAPIARAIPSRTRSCVIMRTFHSERMSTPIWRVRFCLTSPTPG